MVIISINNNQQHSIRSCRFEIFSRGNFKSILNNFLLIELKSTALEENLYNFQREVLKILKIPGF